MKRKKWTEEEEETLINKYSDLLRSGTLAKLRTREKKFEPIAEHVNSIHHCHDPVNFPWEWTWRDVSIKVQNMRHQYLGVKQKIRKPDGEFGEGDEEYNWEDGENHWQNFLKYKEVFGDVELEMNDGGVNKGNLKGCSGSGLKGRSGLGEDLGNFPFWGFPDGDCNRLVGDGCGSDVLGLCLGLEYEGLEGEDEAEADSNGDFGIEKEEEVGFIQGSKKKRLKRDGTGGGCWGARNLGFVGTQLLELRDLMLRKEERQREREFNREEEAAAREEAQRERENQREERRREREERACMREFEWEERERMWARREADRRLHSERERDEERRWRMKMVEKREEEEMEWREKMVSLQVEHEKQMMQMHADACHNQMQMLGILVRLVCQGFGSGNDGLGGLNPLPSQVLQNLQHSGSIVPDNEKTDANSAAHFM